MHYYFFGFPASAGVSSSDMVGKFLAYYWDRFKYYENIREQMYINKMNDDEVTLHCYAFDEDNETNDYNKTDDYEVTIRTIDMDTYFDERAINTDTYFDTLIDWMEETRVDKYISKYIDDEVTLDYYAFDVDYDRRQELIMRTDDLFKEIRRVLPDVWEHVEYLAIDRHVDKMNVEDEGKLDYYGFNPDEERKRKVLEKARALNDVFIDGHIVDEDVKSEMRDRYYAKLFDLWDEPGVIHGDTIDEEARNTHLWTRLNMMYDVTDSDKKIMNHSDDSENFISSGGGRVSKSKKKTSR